MNELYKFLEYFVIIFISIRIWRWFDKREEHYCTGVVISKQTKPSTFWRGTKYTVSVQCIKRGANKAVDRNVNVTQQIYNSVKKGSTITITS